ncbi:MAG: DUF1552 domain-containing protein [Planctomycetota bacterium]
MPYFSDMNLPGGTPNYSDRTLDRTYCEGRLEVSKRHRKITRRTLLRGVGAAVALPWLEVMAPRGRAEETTAPVRLACLYMPNGVHPAAWVPAQSGADYKLPMILEPLAEVRQDVLVLTNLRNSAGMMGDGHYAKTTSWLTGARAVRTGGKDIRAGISFDQLAASKLGAETPLPSLELGIDPVHTHVDMGYSTVYGCHVSWRTATQPAAKEINPRAAFDRLFRSAEFGRNPDDRSVLDLVLNDAKQLRQQVGKSDRQKLDEYLESVRAVEDRMNKSAQSTARKAMNEETAKFMPRPEDKGYDYQAHVRLMLDMMILAFWTDSARVCSFMFGNDVSGRDFSFLDGVKEGFHPVSHHEFKAEKQEQYAKINRWHVAQVADMLKRMKSIQEGDRNLLDNSMLLFGSSISDGNLHSPINVPTLLAGRGGNKIHSGRHIACGALTPLCNVFVTMLRLLNVPTDKFGDSNGNMDKELLV